MSPLEHRSPNAMSGKGGTMKSFAHLSLQWTICTRQSQKWLAVAAKHLSLKDDALRNATDLHCTNAGSCEGKGGYQNIFKNEEIQKSDTSV